MNEVFVRVSDLSLEYLGHGGLPSHRVLIMQHGQAVGEGLLQSVFVGAGHEYVKQMADILRSTAFGEAAARKIEGDNEDR
ncbi:hypothetical protein KJY77_04890 [Canibacter sp. lx-72]|uniref:hypothetical protein n=1 Tax=Canibacter zhuwentaonis TaxID=2837491 RepID=UPI001BDD5167|nr:hypothetical protein [Canibacter zhuwentaonis]MBT1018473.1 hypothetical protein [Canibacter zhuwentaonis]